MSSFSCSQPEFLPAGDRSLNVLVITLDTIRADRLGAYGHPLIQTDFVDGLAERGVLFENCIAPAPLTLPSHTSVFTGTYPVVHGVRDNGNYVVSDHLTTMAELFSEAGFRTGAFVGAFVLSSRWGLDQGFETYTEPESGYDPDLVSFAQIQRRADVVVDDVIEWLRTESARPFFAWVHLYDPHLPYDPPPVFGNQYPDDPYLGEVAYSDDQLARLEDYLRSVGLENRTLVVFAGDHGEGLGDHGELDHGLLLYQTTVRAPLIIAHPEMVAEGVRRREVVSLVDILPTVAEAVGLPFPEDIQGQSLWPLVGGSGTYDERPVYSESHYPKLHFGWSPLAALQDRQYQLIQATDPELYDLARDPRQQENVLQTHPEIAKRMSRDLAAFVEQLGRGGLEAASTPDAETIAKLQALGYVAGGTGTADGQRDEDLPNPRNMLWLYNLLVEANNAVSEGDEVNGERMLLEVVEADDSLVDGWVSLGKLYRRQGRMAEAASAFEKAHARRPLDPFLVSRFSTALLSAQRPEEAEQLLLAAEKKHPDDPYIIFAHARVLEKTGRFAEAEARYRRSLTLDPRSAPSHVRLAALALLRGDAAAVEKELEAALRLDPEVPEASLVRGQLFEAQGRPEDAAKAYRDELVLSPGDLSASISLARIEGQLGRPAEQERVLRNAIRANPRSPGPYLILALTFLQREERFAEGLELAHRALEQKPQGRELQIAYFLLADFYNRLGDAEREAEYARLGSSLNVSEGGG